MIDNLCDMLVRFSQRSDNNGSLSFPKEGIKFTSEEFFKKVIMTAKHLYSKGVTQNRYVILSSTKISNYFITYWATLFCGAVPIVVSNANQSDLDRELLGHIMEIFPEAITLTDSDIPTECSVDLKLPLINSNVPIGIFFSSGSTGNPKGIVLSHKNMLAHLKKVSKFRITNPNDTYFSWLPVFHILGFSIFHLEPIWHCANQVWVSPNDFISSPKECLTLVTDTKANYLSMVNFGLKLLSNVKDITNIDLTNVKSIIIGGEPLRISYMEEFNKKFKSCGLSESAFSNMYGMTECCCDISIVPNGVVNPVIHIAKSPNVGEKVSIVDGDAIEVASGGYPIVDVKIVDSANQKLSDGYFGRILISSCATCSQMVIDGNLTECSSWLDTGDLGFIFNGQLYPIGRSSEVIILNGNNYYPKDLEHNIEILAPELKQRVVVSQVYYNDGSQKCVVFLKLDGIMFTNEDITKLNDILQASQHFSYTTYVPIDDIPLTRSKKVDRKRLSRDYLDGKLKEISLDSATTIKLDNSLLHTIWNDSFRHSNGCVDSIGILKISSEVMKHFNRAIPISELYKVHTPEELSQLIETHTCVEKFFPQITTDIEHFHELAPITQIQQAYLIGRNPFLDIGGTSTHMFYQYETHLDIPRLENAVNYVISRESILRTVFPDSEHQQILKSVERFKINITDVSNLSSPEQLLTIDNLYETLSHEVFDPTQYPLFKMEAIKINATTHMLLLSIDLLILDASSLIAFRRKVLQAYDHALKPNFDYIPDFTFRDFVRGVQTLKNTPKYDTDRVFWKSKLEEFPNAPQLPTLMDSLEIEHPHFKRIQFNLDTSKYERLQSFARSEQISVSSILCSIYALILAYHSGQNDCALNLTVMNRYPFHKDVATMLGDFTSTMLVPFHFGKDSNFIQLCQATQTFIADGLEHRFYSGLDVIRDINERFGNSGKSTMPYVYTSTLGVETSQNFCEFGKLVRGISQTVQVYIDCQVHEDSNGLIVNWDYVSELFSSELIESMFGKFKTMVDMLINGNTSILDTLRPNDSEISYIKSYNATQCEIPTGLLHSFAERQAKVNPNTPAIYDGQSVWTYSQLESRANDIACALQHRGVKVGMCVGVVSHRCAETIAEMLGILKVGASYVPIDVDNPYTRQRQILNSSDCVLCLDAKNPIQAVDGEYVKPNIDTSQVAYIIHTSGSTGNPKGVMISHDAVVNTIIDVNTRYNVAQKDVVFGLSSMCFDLSVYDIFGSQLAGAMLVIVPDLHNVREVTKLAYDTQVTVWNSVPAIMQMYVEELERSDVPFAPIRLAMLSGDWIPLNLPNRMFKLFNHVDIYSLGGATEASIWSINYPIREVNPNWNSIPHGMPLANQTMYILDGSNRLCPIGTIGEICIGGRGVALGYKNDIQKTEKSFFVHKTLGRLYRTGDLGRLTSNGYIEFMGRNDGQVKVHGHRIELGEIENALRKLSIVNDVVVLVQKTNLGLPEILAYLVTSQSTDIYYIQDTLSQYIPEYMIPTQIYFLPSIPVTTNGKVDRKILLSMSEKLKQSKVIHAPTNALQTKLLKVWSEVLNTDCNDIKTSFFAYNGDSIKMIHLCAKILDEFNVRVSNSELLKALNVERQAELIEKHIYMDDISKADEVFTVFPNPQDFYKPFPLTEMQMSYLLGRTPLFELGNISTHAYYEYEVEYTPEQLQYAVNKVIAEQPMLRTIITKDGKQTTLREVPPFNIDVVDCQSMSISEVETLIKSKREIMSHKIFNTNNFPLFEMAMLTNTSKHKNMLLFGCDLIVMDSFSMNIFQRDVAKYCLNPNAKSPKIDFTFRDYVLGFQELTKTDQYIKDRDYWLSKIDSYKSVSSFPMVKGLREIKSPKFSRKQLTLAPNAWNALKQNCAKHEVSVSALVCTVYAKVLSEASQQDDGTINLTVYRRYPFHKHVKNIVGDFTSNMLLPYDFSNKSKPIWEHCKELGSTLIEGMEHLSFSGTELFKELKKRNRNLGNILPVVFTSTLVNGNQSQDATLGRQTFGITQTSQVYLDCQVYEIDGSLLITWDYIEELLNSNEINLRFSQLESTLLSLSQLD